MYEERLFTGRAARFILVALFAVLLNATHREGNSWSGPPPVSNEEIFGLIKQAGGKEEHPQDHSLVVLQSTDVTVEDTGLSHVVERRIVKILDVEGIRESSVQRFNYDPATQHLEIRWARVFKADGKILDLDAGKVKDLPQPMWGIYWPARMKVLEAGGMEKGDALAYEVYKKGFQIAYLLDPDGGGEGEEKYIPPMKGHYYDVVLFEEALPVKEKRYEIHVSRKKPFHWEVYNGTLGAKHVFDDEMDHFAWWRMDMPALPDEKRQPERSDFVTKLVLATVKSWKEKSVWFFNINDPVFAFDDAIKKKVGEITAGAKTEDEKVKRLLVWVAHKIRYSGITMGKGEGYTIHPGIMTFQDRCGVCKDIAGMLVTMMRAGGYEVYPAMTMAGARVEWVPADQFNHCVVVWKRKDGRYELLDPTWMPFDTGTWSLAEGEQDYLIGTAGGEDLKRTEPYRPEENKFVITGRSDIDGEGNLSGKMKIAATGYPETRMRRALAYQAAKENEAFFHRLLSSISPLIRIEKFGKGDLHDLGRQFFVEAAYSIEGYAAVSPEKTRFVIPLAHHVLREERWSPYIMLGSWKERKNPAMFWFPQIVSVTEEVEPPAGYVLESAPDEVESDGDIAYWRFSVKEKGSCLRYEALLKIKRRLAVKKDFEELDRLVAVIEKMENAEVILVAGKKKRGGK